MPNCHKFHIKRFVVKDDVMTDEVATCHYASQDGSGQCVLLSGHYEVECEYAD